MKAVLGWGEWALGAFVVGMGAFVYGFGLLVYWSKTPAVGGGYFGVSERTTVLDCTFFFKIK